MKLRNIRTGETITIKGDWEIIPENDEFSSPPPWTPHVPYPYPSSPTVPAPDFPYVPWTSDDSRIFCMNSVCTECGGSGTKADGSPCVHFISCSCPRCSPRC